MALIQSRKLRVTYFSAKNICHDITELFWGRQTGRQFTCRFIKPVLDYVVDCVADQMVMLKRWSG